MKLTESYDSCLQSTLSRRCPSANRSFEFLVMQKRYQFQHGYDVVTKCINTIFPLKTTLNCLGVKLSYETKSYLIFDKKCNLEILT